MRPSGMVKYEVMRRAVLAVVGQAGVLQVDQVLQVDGAAVDVRVVGGSVAVEEVRVIPEAVPVRVKAEHAAE